MSTATALTAMGDARRTLLSELKLSGPLSIGDLAERIGISYEAVRQQLGQLEHEGWIGRRVERDSRGPGRPRSLYRLTTAGDHLFPKAYDELAVELIDAATERLGPEAVRELLEEVARRKVNRLRPLLEGRSPEARLDALQHVYREDDPFCRVERDADGTAQLIELNCPFLEVARRRPALCSVTVSVLRHLLGRQVVRTERFQNGDGRCVFRVLDEPADDAETLFRWEPAAGGGDDR